MEKESESNKKQVENKQKILLEIIKRYDAYISAANTKIAVILSYAMAYIGGVTFKIIDINKNNQVISDYIYLGIWLLAAASVLATLFSAYKAYLALNPQTPSGRGDNEEASIIFFGDVAKMAGGRDAYVNRIVKIEDEEILKDLARQAYVLAGIVESKMLMLKNSIDALVTFQIPFSILTIMALWFCKV